LLRGTGSNVYNANVAQALARLGHEVHLLCQDRDAAALPWVDALGRWSGGRLEVRGSGGRSPGPGKVTAYLPDIGGLLPVYVRDRYEGFEVKTFPELSDAELDRYLDANVAAVNEAARRAGGIEAALANHLVMGPAILARSGLPYAVKIHGSALEFTVKRHPDRFLPYAREGTEAAAAVLAGSRHTAESLWAALGDPELPSRTRLGPPGVDVERFGLRPRSVAEAGLRELAVRLAGADRPDGRGEFGRDTTGAARALEEFAAARGPRVVFVGKLIRTKGVDLLLAAWPLVAAQHPGARLLVVGFGEARRALERLAEDLAAGDLEAVRALATGESGERLRLLGAYLAAPAGDYAQLARAAAGSVSFAGRLEHDEVAEMLPACDAMVVPSTFPESFGMVAVEAAAAGVLPVSSAHSGLLEVSQALAEPLPQELRELLSFELDVGAVEAIADRLTGWLALPAARREAARLTLASTARERWSWEGVARGIIAASQGHLDELPDVPAATPAGRE
jgi:glycosyltransferase involved in cell wall biosynthesis